MSDYSKNSVKLVFAYRTWLASHSLTTAEVIAVEASAAVKVRTASTPVLE
jgi:hypothetical protein